MFVLIILCAASCSGVSYKASIYSTNTEPDDISPPDRFTYIHSLKNLQKYYDKYENAFGRRTNSVGWSGPDYMEDKVFFNDKYNADFFEEKCLLFIMNKDTVVKYEMKVDSVVWEDDVLKINVDHLEGVYDDMITEVHIVIELDKEYADKEVGLTWNGH